MIVFILINFKMNIYALTIKAFKNLLVNNRYRQCQDELDKSLYYPFYKKSYHELTPDERDYCR